MTNQAYVRLYCAIREHIAELRGPRLACLLAIATRANGEGEAWPSLTRLCKDTGYTRPTVVEATDWLCEHKWLSRKGSRGIVTHYYIETPHLGTSKVTLPVESPTSKTSLPVRTPTSKVSLPDQLTQLTSTSKTILPEEGTTEEGTMKKREGGEPRARARPPKPKAQGCPWCRNPRKETEGTHHLLQWVHNYYRETFGECPTLAPARDGKLLSGLAQQHGEDAVKQAYANYLASTHRFYAEKGWPLTMFAQDFDGLRTNKQQKPSWQRMKERVGNE